MSPEEFHSIQVGDIINTGSTNYPVAEIISEDFVMLLFRGTKYDAIYTQHEYLREDRTTLIKAATEAKGIVRFI
jgi:hypothetical protein